MGLNLRVDGGVVVETIHAGETGFDGLGGVLARFIHRNYGKIKADPNSPLSEAGKRATDKLLKREEKENRREQADTRYEAKDAQGHEHAGAGSEKGGQFVSKGQEWEAATLKAMQEDEED